MRKALIILLVVLVVIGGVYFFYIRPRVTTGQPVPNILTSFFPKTTSTGNNFGPDTNPDGSPIDANAGAAASEPALKQLSPRPIAGYTIYSITTPVSIPSTDPKIKPIITYITDHYVRYVSRVNGYVYEIKNKEIPLQVSNIFIPNIYEAMFADSNNTAILRFLRNDNNTIATYSIPVPPLNSDGTRTQVPGIYLSDNIYNLTVSPDQKSVVRITRDAKGTTVSSSTTTGSSIKKLFTSTFMSWLPQWTTSGVYLQTKAASKTDGYVYLLDQSSSRLKRIVGNIKGLTTSVSPSGQYVLYSESSDTGFSTKIYNSKTSTISAISLNILPEKCAWLQNENLICAGNTSVDPAVYPDSWYAGINHFNDNLYQINTASNTFSTIYTAGIPTYDMINIQVDEAQQLVFFIDKNTGLLYSNKY
ncbi:MAG: hypothetical protein ABIO57_00820 [Candidatus Paceibacterota bacterium]